MEETAIVDVQQDRIIQACLETMEHAIDSFNGASKNAFDACIELGNAAGMVREKLPHGEFGPWVEAHFGPKSDHPMSIQWIRHCINAARVVGSIKSESKKKKLLAQYTDVRSVSKLLPIVEAGNDPLEPPAEEEEGEGTAPATPVRTPGRVQLSPEALSAFPEIGKREKELDKREKELDKREAKLNAREEALDKREAKLKALAAAIKAGEKKANGKAKGKAKETVPDEPDDTDDVSEAAALAGAHVEPPGSSADVM